jgi:hypothetical protein
MQTGKFTIAHKTWISTLAELLFIAVVAYFFAGTLIDFDPDMLQQAGEEHQSVIRPIIASISLGKYHEIPLWNHFMQKGMPFAGDLHGHFWSPVSTIPAWIWGGFVGLKISLFISFLIAGLGQWYLSKTMGIKGMFRVWSAIAFMCSGGLALLARLGWYELLVGVAWFPPAFASFWQALNKKGALPIFWAAFCSAMILTTGGGYYPFYLFVAMLVIFIFAIFLLKQDKRTTISRGVITAVALFGLIAVMTFPIYDSYRFITRDVVDDPGQRSSQPIHYALFNYVVSDPEWFGTSILDLAGGYNWFYISPMVLAAWIFLPIALRKRTRTPFFITSIFLFLTILSWHSNKFTFFKYIYEWIPFLYGLRFPGRLLIVAASPLIAISAYMLQNGFSLLRRKASKTSLELTVNQTKFKLNTRWLLLPVCVLILVYSGYNTYSVNQSMAFYPLTPLDPRASQTIEFIKSRDPGTYYVQFGEAGSPYWSFISVAMNYEIPAINARYGTLLNNVAQQSPDDAIVAEPKFIIISTQTPPTNGVFLREYDNIGIWEVPDALPMALTTNRSNITEKIKLTNQNTLPLTMQFQGPNRIIVSGEPKNEGDPLVLLVSDYPGWKVYNDGRLLPIKAVNGYMTTPMTAGIHTYTFVFDPFLYKAGLAVSILTILIFACLIIAERVNSLQKFLPWKI